MAGRHPLHPAAAAGRQRPAGGRIVAGPVLCGSGGAGADASDAAAGGFGYADCGAAGAVGGAVGGAGGCVSDGALLAADHRLRLSGVSYRASGEVLDHLRSHYLHHGGSSLATPVTTGGSGRRLHAQHQHQHLHQYQRQQQLLRGNADDQEQQQELAGPSHGGPARASSPPAPARARGRDRQQGGQQQQQQQDARLDLTRLNITHLAACCAAAPGSSYAHGLAGLALRTQAGATIRLGAACTSSSATLPGSSSSSSSGESSQSTSGPEWVAVPAGYELAGFRSWAHDFAESLHYELGYGDYGDESGDAAAAGGTAADGGVRQQLGDWISRIQFLFVERS
ncbi:hypothetical protein HXX76_016203 [Chlamydomonas incerta]|uniref:Uncharacterized protein n=1 Tax=Chlamydomonas incerta TaxID=51695 RepID=A0A835SF29_CHLIN|nr:hypothetical protein HXX76_016203 [Chlamydomonas incerta]|eukprot:KAG2422223.1 hypothetical protein HXX76_016203 [Chlamydomonas incerta]